ncbi:MAG: PAS domain S-box protein [Chloroflexi bacterium]|nr:PAS domain S-box protein [Chloroflexota bacterium]
MTVAGSAEQLKTLYEVSRSLVVASSDADFLQVFLDMAAQDGACQVALHYVYPESAYQTLCLEFIESVQTETYHGLNGRTARHRFEGKIIQQQPHQLEQVFFVSDAEKTELPDELTPMLDELRQTGDQSGLLMPLIVGLRWVGLISIQWRERQAFEEPQQYLYKMLYPQLASLVQYRRLLQRTEEALEQTERLHRIGQELIRHEDPDAWLSVYSEEMFSRVSKCQSILMHVHYRGEQPSFLEMIATDRNQEGLKYQAPKVISLDEFEMTSKTVLSARESVVYVPDVAHSGDKFDPAFLELVQSSDVKALAIVPLITPGSRLIAIVAFAFYEAVDLLPSDLQFYELLSPQFASLVENHVLLHESQQTEERFRDIAFSTSDLLWEVTVDGLFTYCSDRFVDVLGHTPTELLGRPLSTLMTEDEMTSLFEMLAPHVQERRGFTEIEHMVHRRDGRLVWLQSSGKPRFDQDRNVISYRGTSKDITQSKDSQQREELAYHIGRQLTTVLELDDLLKATVEQTRKALDYYHVHIRMWDKEQGTLIFREGSGRIGDQMKEYIAALPLDAEPSLIARAARLRRPIVSFDVRNDPYHLPNPLLPETRSEIALPLLRGGRLLGVLDVQARAIGRFTNAEVRTLENLAAQLSVAIENARLYESERRQRQIAEMLLETTEALTGSLNLGEVLLSLAENLLHISRCQVCTIHEWDPKNEHLATIAEFSRVHWHQDSGRTYQLDDFPTTRSVLEDNQAVTMSSRSPDHDPHELTWMTESGLSSVMMLPVRRDGQVVGLAELSYVSDTTLEADLMARCQTILDEAARDFERPISLTTDSRLLDVASRLIAVSESHSCAISDWDREADTIRTTVSYSNLIWQGRNERTVENLRNSHWSTVLKSGEPVIMDASQPDLAADLRDQLELWRVQTLVVLPLTTNRRRLGLVQLFDVKEQVAVTDQNLRLWQTIVDQAAVSIENARLYNTLEQQAGRLEELVIDRTTEIARERERLTTIVESAGESIMLTGPTGRIEYVNPAWERMTGFNRHDVLGRRLRQLMNEPGVLTPVETLWSLVDAIRQRQFWEGDFHIKRKDGTEYDAALTVAPVIEHRRIVNLVVVMRDVTANKEIERMRKQFIASVSHELRTPITNLKLYLTLVRSGPSQRRAEYLETMGTQLGRLERLVEDLLDISRMERGVLSISPERLDINDLVRAVMRTYTTHITAQDRRLSVLYQERMPIVYADRDRLMQVLVNLINNAINYSSPQDHISVETATNEGADDQASFVSISISDTGMGIAPDELPFIFDRFFRADNAKTTEVPGTGLGLSIVKEIVERHGGFVSVSSRLNEGTRFTVMLPVATDEDPQLIESQS